MITMYDCKIRTSVERRTPFVCPVCGDDSEGLVVQRTRWMSALSIPVIPLESLDKVVECRTCGRQSDLGALDIPTTAMLAEYVRNATRHAVAMIVRAGCTDTESIDPLVHIEAVATLEDAGVSLTSFSLSRDVVELNDADTVDHLAKLVDELTPHGKSKLLNQLIGIALTDGPLTTAERRAIQAIGVALRMPARNINVAVAA